MADAPFGFVIVGRKGEIGDFRKGPIYPTLALAEYALRFARGHYWRIFSLGDPKSAHDLAVLRGEAEPEPDRWVTEAESPAATVPPVMDGQTEIGDFIAEAPA